MQYRSAFEDERNAVAFWFTSFPYSIADFVLEMAKFWPKMTWHLPLALFFISLSWWENYVDVWIMPAKVATALANLKYRLKKKRNNVNFLSRFVLEHLEDACPRFCDLTSQKWMRQRGIEPRSTAWKATMLTITPLTRAHSMSK